MSSKYPSKLPPTSDGKVPNVIIVGAGIGGLFLAILLDRAGIPYQIFERAKAVRPLGSIMSLSANILPAFEQLGLYEELKAISIQGSHHNSNIMYDDMEIIAALPDPNLDGAIGYEFHLFPRPALHSLLLSKVPAERIHYSKKVLSIQQNKEGVMIRCADDTTYHGDILAGADGAYSGVRQSLFKSLKESNQLPSADDKDISKGYICLLGTTDPLDPAEYPLVSRENCVFSQVIGRGTPYSWAEFNVPDNRICWFVVYQLATEAESEEIKFRNSEWGPEFHGHMIEAVKDFRVPSGTLGNLINHTPRDNISRVFLEDKLFKTWTHGRTVLIGDAAHKLLPSAGQGAVCAMQDALILTNCLYDLKSLSPESIQEALQDYKAQRYSHVKKQFQASKLMAIFLNGQTLMERIIRKIAFNWIPASIKDASMRKDAAYRPQLNFLPLAPKRGTIDVLPQHPSRRHEEEKKKNEGGEKLVAAAAL